MVTMSDEDEAKRKRERESSASPTLQTSKFMKTGSIQDVSVIPLESLRRDQPGSPKILDTLTYEIVVELRNQVNTYAETIKGLEEKVTQQEKKHSESLSQLKSDFDSKLSALKNELQLDFDNKLKGEIDHLKNAPETDFITTMKREVPNLSEGVGKNEEALATLDQKRRDIEREITTFKEKITSLEDKFKNVSAEHLGVLSEGEVLKNGEEINNKLIQIGEAQKIMVKENRRRHLEGDKRDQYSMRDSVRITGVPFKRDEDTNSLVMRIAQRLEVAIAPQDISVSHRTGRRVEGQPRAIICRFTRRDIKYRLLNNKKLARRIRNDDEGNPVRIFIDEKLTPMRSRVCKLLREEKIQHHTQDGKIFITTEDSSNWQVLDTPEEWERWNKPDEVKIDLGVYPRI